MNLLRLFLTVALGLFVAADIIGQPGWRNLPSGTSGDLVSVYFTSDRDGWIAGDGGFLATTSDGGASWDRVAVGAGDDINEIFFRNEENGYLTAGRRVFITRDGGKTWRETKLFNAGDFRSSRPEFLSISFASKKIGFAIGSVLNQKGEVVDSLVMRTGDGGSTWSRVAVPSRLELFHINFPTEKRGWIVGDRGTILATTDAGLTWAAQKSGALRALFDVDFRNGSAGVAVGGGGTILQTTDGGVTWKRAVSRITETLKRVGFADDKNGWAVGHGGAIVRTADGGESWVREQSETTANFYGLYVNKKYAWAAGEAGMLIAGRK